MDSRAEAALQSEKRKFQANVRLLEELERELGRAKEQRRQLREENARLQAEAGRLQAESRALLGHLAGRARRNPEEPLSLWDQHRRQLEEIRRQRRELLDDYEAQRAALRADLLQREADLARLNRELQALEPVRALKETQSQRVRELRGEERAVRAETAARLLEARGRFLREEEALEKQMSRAGPGQGGEEASARQGERALELEAEQGAREFGQQLQGENHRLRKQLLQLVRQARALQARRERLQKQKQWLQRERWCLEATIRGRRRLRERSSLQPRRQGHPQGPCCPSRPPKGRRVVTDPTVTPGLPAYGAVPGCFANQDKQMETPPPGSLQSTYMSKARPTVGAS
ncbi:coiled-coil domain-containing protein 121 [Ornithorhynchus anatinus]|uniref:Coiled-coil domain containing 121 n=1 Tax=Ornithorhynchus anatinus TaxID=9258 RepID=F6PTY7_ORNAN|nr:coiled-coil domain-containing protein 121 [Ornithorhynchus anatinus]